MRVTSSTAQPASLPRFVRKGAAPKGKSRRGQVTILASRRLRARRASH